jgi:hypothetical protein
LRGEDRAQWARMRSRWRGRLPNGQSRGQGSGTVTVIDMELRGLPLHGEGRRPAGAKVGDRPPRFVPVAGYRSGGPIPSVAVNRSRCDAMLATARILRTGGVPATDARPAGRRKAADWRRAYGMSGLTHGDCTSAVGFNSWAMTMRRSSRFDATDRSRLGDPSAGSEARKCMPWCVHPTLFPAGVSRAARVSAWQQPFAVRAGDGEVPRSNAPSPDWNGKVRLQGAQTQTRSPEPARRANAPGVLAETALKSSVQGLVRPGSHSPRRTAEMNNGRRPPLPSSILHATRSRHHPTPRPDGHPRPCSSRKRDPTFPTYC